jgi:hypothetical protein
LLPTAFRYIGLKASHVFSGFMPEESLCTWGRIYTDNTRCIWKVKKRLKET